MDTTKKKPMTDEERLALAAKLDKELDEFIDNLPKRKAPEGPRDENWLEEFDNHPFFMKNVPEAGAPLHPLYEGLQQLKYDPNENTPQELATSYKEDGNFNFKHKNYRLAIISYTEGLKAKCGDGELEASLYNNRSASHWFLKNYRSSLRDAEWALKLKPDYDKALSRAAQCCYQIGKYDDAITYCDQLFEKGKYPDILDLWKKATNAKRDAERVLRKKQQMHKRKQQEESNLLNAIASRGIKTELALTLENLQPKFEEIVQHRVHLNEDKRLAWPVVLVYPEYRVMDFVQEFAEDTTLLHHLQIVLEETPEWDKQGEYNTNNIVVYYEYDCKTKVKKVSKDSTLLDIMKEPSFLLKNGTPCFIILVANSKAEEKFLSSY